MMTIPSKMSKVQKSFPTFTDARVQQDPPREPDRAGEVERLLPLLWQHHAFAEAVGAGLLGGGGDLQEFKYILQISKLFQKH